MTFLTYQPHANQKPRTMFENLDGEKLLSVFQLLVEQQILIKVHLPQSGYESLTIVTDAASNSRQHVFQIDVPKGLHAAIEESGTDHLSFEFTSHDKVTHRFTSKIQTIGENAISMLYPPIIQRRQQRDNFRIKAPMESYATALLNDVKIEMEIDNISLGGVYCYCANRYKSALPLGSALTDMELTFTLRNQCSSVMIQRTAVKRVESGYRPKRFGIAFEFTKISRDDRRLLVQLIYELQRMYLQNRGRKI